MKQEKSAERRPENKEEGWEPSTPDPLRREDRSLDIGESGQFAPGGYYNQQAVTGRGRSHLDDLVPDEHIRKSAEKQDKKPPRVG